MEAERIRLAVEEEARRINQEVEHKPHQVLDLGTKRENMYSIDEAFEEKDEDDELMTSSKRKQTKFDDSSIRIIGEDEDDEKSETPE